MANKGMELLLKLKAQTENSVYQQLAKVKEKADELAQAKKKLKKLEDAESNFKKLKEKYEKLSIQYKKNGQEMAILKKMKSEGIQLSEQEENKLQRLIRTNLKLNERLKSQEKIYELNKKEIDANKNSLEEYKKQVQSLTKEVKELNAAEKVANRVKQIKNNVGNMAMKGASFIGKTAVAGVIAGATGGALLGKAGADTYLEFNANMKKVQAISGATEREYQRLEKEAMKLGATTKFTAGESAVAMEKMALAGFNTEQIIAGMPGVLDLAAAAGEDVAMVSDIITDNLNAFGMSAKDTGRMAEILAWGMSKTNINVEMLGESFKFVAGSAGTLGVSLETTVATLGLMGDQAIKSGMAGRGLNEVFSRLVSQKDKLKQIGVTVEDSKGNFVGLTKVVADFEKVTKNMTSVDKVQFLKNVFGEQGERSFSKLLSAQKEINGVVYKGAEALEKSIEAATNDSVGLATKMKNIMLEGAAGTMVLLSSAWDGVKNAIGKLIFSPVAINILKKVTEMLSELANVLNGEFNNNKFNKFFKTFFDEVKTIGSKIWEIIAPAREAILSLFQEATPDLKVFKSLIYELARAFNVIVTTAVSFYKILDTIGIDNIAVFTTLFVSVIKTISLFNTLKSSFLAFKEVTGVLSLVKLGITALGGPIALLAAVIVATVGLIYYNWDTVKAFLLGVFDSIVSAWNWLSNSIVSASMWLFDTLKTIFMWIFEHSPIGLVIDFINSWDSSKGVIENLQNVFMRFTEKFQNFLPVKLAKEFFNIWTGNLSLVDKIKATFTNSFDIIANTIIKVIDNIKNLGSTIAELPVINTILKSIGIVSEEKTDVDGSHRNGLSNVPFDGYIAELHRNERVLTAAENEEYSNGMFLNKFLSISKPATSNINNSKVEFVYNLHVDLKVNLTTTESIDDLKAQFKNLQEELYRDFMRKIKELERGTNERRLQF